MMTFKNFSEYLKESLDKKTRRRIAKKIVKGRKNSFLEIHDIPVIVDYENNSPIEYQLTINDILSEIEDRMKRKRKKIPNWKNTDFKLLSFKKVDGDGESVDYYYAKINTGKWFNIIKALL